MTLEMGVDGNCSTLRCPNKEKIGPRDIFITHRDIPLTPEELKIKSNSAERAVFGYPIG
jgi:hypothetical protein